MKNKFREVREYMNRLLKHLGHHCCSLNNEEHNRMLDILYELEREKR